MGDTAINVPVEVRSHELEQMNSMVPRVADILEDVGRDEDAEEVRRIYDEHIEETGRPYIWMPADDWRAVVRHLDRVRDEEGLRVWWLRKKLVSRLRDRLAEVEDE